MKSQRKFIIILAVVFVAMVVLEMLKPTPINWAHTYSQKDKIPYGNFILYRMLPRLFPKSSVEIVREPIYNALPSITADSAEWKDSSPPLYVFINEKFSPDDLDTKTLLEFVNSGGTVFASAETFKGKLADTLKFSTSVNYSMSYSDSNVIHLTSTAFSNNSKQWLFKKGTTTHYFHTFDTVKSTIIATNFTNDPILLRMKFGKGYFYLSSTPLCFTNYSILDKWNRDFISKSFSFINSDRILWDEYYKVGREEATSPFRYILSVESLRYAYYLILVGAVLFVLFRAKRNQRIIPVIQPVRNSTLDFVQTVGRMYYEQNNHANLADKKIQYFLEHIRSTYFVRTNEFTEEFLYKTAGKSGVDITKVRALFFGIENAIHKESLTEQELILLHTKIDSFYKESLSVKSLPKTTIDD
ncbi:MAG: hypothetical protein JST20_03500 [Bacteroidetes bacterium]|nr:hypothetical protein [Bacteroidota bacterium]